MLDFQLEGCARYGNEMRKNGLAMMIYGKEDKGLHEMVGCSISVCRISHT